MGRPTRKSRAQPGWPRGRSPARHLLLRSCDVAGAASTDRVWPALASTLTAATSTLPMLPPTNRLLSRRFYQAEPRSLGRACWEYEPYFFVICGWHPYCHTTILRELERLNSEFFNEWSPTPHGRNVCLRRKMHLLSLWPWSLTSDLENFFSNGHSQCDYLYQFSLKPFY